MKALKPIVAATIIASLGFLGRQLDVKREAARSVLSGTFESRPVTIAARVAGRVQAIVVSEGDSVPRHALLVQLEADPVAAQTEALRSRAKSSLGTIDSLRLKREEELTRQSGVIRELEANLSKALAGNRSEEIQVAAQRMSQAAARYRNLVSGPRPDEIAQAVAEEARAKAELAKVLEGPKRAERDRLQAELEAAIADREQAQRDANRARMLANEGALSMREAERAESSLVAIEKRVVAAKATLDSLNPRSEDIDAARANLQRAQAALKLLESGTRPEEIVAAKAALEEAKYNLALLKRGTRAEDIRALTAKLDQAKSAYAALATGSSKLDVENADLSASATLSELRAAELQLDEARLKAPIAGVVERLLVAEGDLVTAGQALMKLSSKDLDLRVFVPEARLAEIKVGTDAKLKIDGIEEEVVGVVASVASSGEYTPANLQTPSERGKQVFAVRIRLKHPNSRVKAGIFASVRQIGDWRIQ